MRSATIRKVFVLYGLSFKILVLPCLVFPLLGQEQQGSVFEYRTVRRISVLGNVDWTDTGFDVAEGQEIYFRASGGISLQKGNPMAYCGPDGYNLKTVQQPLRDKNIGALIGRVVYLISIEVDEETGEESRTEISEEFYIGKENRAKMPLSGRLFLGINENLVGDNVGEFDVVIYLNEERGMKSRSP